MKMHVFFRFTYKPLYAFTLYAYSIRSARIPKTSWKKRTENSSA